MGNIPAKITGKYQSYDINTPSHSTPQIPVRHQDQIESHLSKEECAPVVASDEHNEQQDEVNFNQTANSAANSVYNEQPVDAGDDEYVETHVSNHLDNSPRQVDVMY